MPVVETAQQALGLPGPPEPPQPPEEEKIPFAAPESDRKLPTVNLDLNKRKKNKPKGPKFKIQIGFPSPSPEEEKKVVPPLKQVQNKLPELEV